MTMTYLKYLKAPPSNFFHFLRESVPSLRPHARSQALLAVTKIAPATPCPQPQHTLNHNSLQVAKPWDGRTHQEPRLTR